MAIYAFLCTVGAAALTSFYSWRLIFKTFHGTPHDHHHYEQAQESPIVMLVPLAALAAGALFAGYPFKELFAGRGVAEFFRQSIKFADGNHVLVDMEHVPYLIRILPYVMIAIG